MVNAMEATYVAKQLKTIPLSNSSISIKIKDISEDLHEQLISGMMGKLFAIQVDEATDSSQDSMLMGVHEICAGYCLH